MPRATGLERVEAWFAGRGWQPWDFQRQAWRAYLDGKDGLIQVPTGAGKTYAAFGGPLAELCDASQTAQDESPASPLAVLYISPLRAVTRDIEQALRLPIDQMGLRLRVESRTGDTTAGVRARQRQRLPEVLVTTPESLALLLTADQARARLSGLRCVIVDEWHELLVSKRGTMTELCLARLRAWNPSLRTWGMSATLPNSQDALRALVGSRPRRESVIVRGAMERPIVVRTVFPSRPEHLPWAGHLGLAMLPDVLDALDVRVPTIVFTNTRSQAERWFHAIAYARPQWAGVMALHHGSLDREERERVEAGLKAGTLTLVVATSSLDLGVDFAPLERVVQIGSPKGIARVVQRAGRAAHRPNASCEILCVPTHQLELLEVAAARRAMLAGEVEDRTAPDKPLDVLAQHMVTCGMGGTASEDGSGAGFLPDELFEEVRGAWSYRHLTRQEFDWALMLVREGGVLHAYPQFRRLSVDESGVHRVTSPRVAQVHRLNVGTITADGSLEIRLERGRSLGQIDEHFVGNLRPGQRFVFAGKVLRFVGLRDCVVIVRPDAGKSGVTPAWAGTRLPISESLASGMRAALHAVARGDIGASEPELRAALPLVRAQLRESVVPRPDQLLVELAQTREGWHCFLFPFEGRLVHAGLAALLALRLTRRSSASFSIAVNDYGLELLCEHEYPFARHIDGSLFTHQGLHEDVAQSVDMSQLAKVAFREVARVAGLVAQAYPGVRKTGRQLHASSNLMFDVLHEHDPANLLLAQARREVLERFFEQDRLSRTLARLGSSELLLRETARLTPLAFPLIVERESSKVSSETLLERLARMKQQWGVA